MAVTGRPRSFDDTQVIAHAKERLANFKVPRQVEVVGSLPRNLSGKVLKEDLRGRPAGRGAPQPRAADTAALAAP